MPDNIILPTNDLAFKKLFANNQHKEIIKGLIQDFYGITIKSIIIENPYSIDEFNDIIDKKGYFAVEVDSFCTSENNWKFSTEMQLLKRNFYPERSLYYLCGKYNSTYGNTELMRGESKYSSLYPTFSINILGYNHFKSDQKAVRRFTLYDEENQQPFHSPGLFTIGFFELRKPEFDRYRNLRHWQDLFLSGQISQDAPSYVKTAADMLKTANFSKEEREMINALEKATQDRIAEREYAFEEGIEKGKKENSVQIAKVLYKKGMSSDEIIDITNLTHEEIQSIIEDL